MENRETPFYEYDLGKLKRNLSAIKNSADTYNFKVHYAIKANYQEKIIETIASYDIGADCVSGGEVLASVQAGFKPNKIVLAGVGKTDREIEIALDNSIYCFNCESLQEIEVIQEIAFNKGVVAPIAIRINPNVDAQTHHFITTGLNENKFGIREHEIEQTLNFIKKSKNLKFLGLHFHIGSQITSLNVFENLCLKVNTIQDKVESFGFSCALLNLGGGLGVDYSKFNKDSNIDYAAFFDTIHRTINRRKNQEIHFELGRSIVGNVGKLITKVLYIKKGIKKNFAILDAGMTELMRPALYQAKHKLECLSDITDLDSEIYDIVGPICESTDVFVKNTAFPTLKRGDYFAIHTVGAYGECMATNYNLRFKNPSVFIEE